MDNLSQQSQEQNTELVEPTNTHFKGIRLSAILIILLGLSCSVYWLINYIVLDQLTVPGYMVAFSTGLCFILEGIALIAYTVAIASRNRIRIIILGSCISLVAILALIDNFTHCNCGIDNLLYSILIDSHAHHKIVVMALNTAVAQLFIGFIIILIPKGDEIWVAITLHILTLLCFLIGFISFLGYSFELDILYRWYGIQPMSLFSSIGIVVITFSLWQIWHREIWFENLYKYKENLRITVVFSLIVFVVVMISALAVFSETIKRERKIAREALVEDVGEKTYLLNKYIQQAERVASDVRKSMMMLVKEKTNKSTSIEESVKLILTSSGATAFFWQDANNQELLSHMQLTSEPELTVTLPEQGKLLLKNNKLFIRFDISMGDEIINVEWYLPLLTEFLTFETGREKIGDIFLCTLISNHKKTNCYLSAEDDIFLDNLLTKDKDSLEIKNSVGNIEILAFSRISELNLWLVMKKNLSQTNHYNRETINRILLAIVLSILLGVFIQFWQVNPLLSGLITTRYDAFKAKAKLVENEKALKDGLNIQARLNEEASKLTLMTTALQTCASLAEAAEICVWYSQKLLPNTNGLLFLILPSKSELERISSWGTVQYKKYIRAKDCWAIREASQHIVKDPNQDMICEHVKFENTIISPYFCSPLFAQGEIMGLLYIEFPKFSASDISENIINLINHLSSSMALALSNIRLREDLLSQSIHDPLTGLFNRKYLDEVFSSNMSLAIRKNLGLSVMMIDIDHFKELNDKFGHQAGDLVLQTVGKLLQNQIRLYNTACRFGGEEFLIVMVDIMREDAIKRAELLREIIEKLEIVYHGELLPRVTVSIGLASFPENANNSQMLIELADKALYQAKASGRNRVEVSK
ncbi:MAG: sensor domain-containing diguanylate cyclase [Gammaproteobacteria bacterium]|nr:sensor domain-containing diguanylate cyclase [Gammaproteobacteria bacterium]